MTLPTDNKSYHASILTVIAFTSYFDEACFTDYLVETPRDPKKPFQKKSSFPFGSKAGTLTTLNLMLWSLLYVN